MEFIHENFPLSNIYINNVRKELISAMDKESSAETGYEMEKVVLPQIASIKQASKLMGLPPYYLRRLCKEVPGLAFQ